MATSLLPTILEVFDGITRLIDNPEISLAELMADETDEDSVTRLGIKGPTSRPAASSAVAGIGAATPPAAFGPRQGPSRTSRTAADRHRPDPHQFIQSTLVERIAGRDKRRTDQGHR